MKQVKIVGMSCAHCVAAVKGALEELGLTGVSVDLESGIAIFDPTDVSAESIAAAIDDAGFDIMSTT